jgi:hypothetical protein
MNSVNEIIRNNRQMKISQFKYHHLPEYTPVLSGSIKQLSHDPKQFQNGPGRFLIRSFFYSMDEYFKYVMD